MRPALLLLALLLAFPADATERSTAAKRAFVKAHACPATGQHKLPCRGFVIDHIKALDCGGRDAPSNMQWQTVADAKEKDRWERNGPGCRHRTHGDRG
jgi:hypothetical protein